MTIRGSMAFLSRGPIICFRSTWDCKRSQLIGELWIRRSCPGHGMKFSSSTTEGDVDTRTAIITATNGDVGPAYTTQISGFMLTQIFGERCNLQITPPGSFPIVLGDIPTSGSADAAFRVNIVGCRPDSLFLLSVPWGSAVYHTGTFETILDSRDEAY